MTAGELAGRLGARVPTLGLLEACRCERLPGETLYETAERVLSFEALLEASGSQKGAAESLGVSARKFHYLLQNLGWTRAYRPRGRS